MGGKRARRMRWKPVDLADVFDVISSAASDVDLREDDDDEHRGHSRSATYRKSRPHANKSGSSNNTNSDGINTNASYYSNGHNGGNRYSNGGGQPQQKLSSTGQNDIREKPDDRRAAYAGVDFNEANGGSVTARASTATAAAAASTTHREREHEQCRQQYSNNSYQNGAGFNRVSYNNGDRYGSNYSNHYQHYHYHSHSSCNAGNNSGDRSYYRDRYHYYTSDRPQMYENTISRRRGQHNSGSSGANQNGYQQRQQQSNSEHNIGSVGYHQSNNDNRSYHYHRRAAGGPAGNNDEENDPKGDGAAANEIGGNNSDKDAIFSGNTDCCTTAPGAIVNDEHDVEGESQCSNIQQQQQQQQQHDRHYHNNNSSSSSHYYSGNTNKNNNSSSSIGSYQENNSGRYHYYHSHQSNYGNDNGGTGGSYHRRGPSGSLMASSSYRNGRESADGRGGAIFSRYQGDPQMNSSYRSNGYNSCYRYQRHHHQYHRQYRSYGELSLAPSHNNGSSSSNNNNKNGHDGSAYPAAGGVRSDRYHYNKEDYCRDSTDTSETSSTNAYTETLPVPPTGIYINGLWIPSGEVERMIVNGELPPPPFGPSIPPSSASGSAQRNVFYFYAYVKKDKSAGTVNVDGALEHDDDASQSRSKGVQEAPDDDVHSTEELKDNETPSQTPGQDNITNVDKSDEYVPVIYASWQPPPRRVPFKNRRIRRRRYLDDNYVDLESDNCDIITKVTSKNYRFISSLDETSDQDEQGNSRGQLCHRSQRDLDAGFAGGRAFNRDATGDRDTPESSGTPGSLTPPASDFDRESSDLDREAASASVKTGTTSTATTPVSVDTAQNGQGVDSEIESASQKVKADQIKTSLKDQGDEPQDDAAIIPHTQIECTIPTNVKIVYGTVNAEDLNDLDSIRVTTQNKDREMLEQFAQRAIEGVLRDAIQQVRADEENIKERLNQPGCSGITPTELYAEEVARQIMGGVMADSGRRRPPPIVIEDSINANPTNAVSGAAQEKCIRQHAELMASEIIRSALHSSKTAGLASDQEKSDAQIETKTEATTTSGGRLAGVRNALRQGVKESGDFLGEGATSPGLGEASPMAPFRTATAMAETPPSLSQTPLGASPVQQQQQQLSPAQPPIQITADQQQNLSSSSNNNNNLPLTWREKSSENFNPGLRNLSDCREAVDRHVAPPDPQALPDRQCASSGESDRCRLDSRPDLVLEANQRRNSNNNNQTNLLSNNSPSPISSSNNNNNNNNNNNREINNKVSCTQLNSLNNNGTGNDDQTSTRPRRVEDVVVQLDNDESREIRDGAFICDVTQSKEAPHSTTAERRSLGGGASENRERTVLLRETSITSYGSGVQNGNGASSSSLPPDSGVQSEVDEDEHVVFAVTPPTTTMTPAAGSGDVIATNGIKSPGKLESTSAGSGHSAGPLLQTLASKVPLLSEARNNGFPFGFCCCVM